MEQPARYPHYTLIHFIIFFDIFIRYPANVIRNQKYNPITFLPVILYEQFKFFFNMYFLLVALSQFIPALQIGMFPSFILFLLQYKYNE